MKKQHNMQLHTSNFCSFPAKNEDNLNIEQLIISHINMSLIVRPNSRKYIICLPLFSHRYVYSKNLLEIGESCFANNLL
jgi:hypothetical protein